MSISGSPKTREPRPAMKYDYLLQHREELLKAARLANLSFAHQWLGNFAARIARSGLAGEVVLHGPSLDANRAHPVLIAQDFSQSVVDEHFLDTEIAELHGVFSLVHETGVILEMRFRLEDINEIYLPALRRALEVFDVLPRNQPSPARGANLDAA
jgi:hypothetical protein